MKQDRAAKGGNPYYDFPQKIARLGSLLSALQFLHSAKVVIGDLQWNNILTTGTEPYNSATSAEVYFVDCDSFIIDGRAPLTNMDPMSWRPPYPTSGFSAITDMYKFALMVIRCLSEQTNQDTVDYSLYKHLLPSSDFAKLHSLLTSPDPGLTSGDLGALARAWQASVSATAACTDEPIARRGSHGPLQCAEPTWLDCLRARHRRMAHRHQHRNPRRRGNRRIQALRPPRGGQRHAPTLLTHQRVRHIRGGWSRPR